MLFQFIKPSEGFDGFLAGTLFVLIVISIHNGKAENQSEKGFQVTIEHMLLQNCGGNVS